MFRPMLKIALALLAFAVLTPVTAWGQDCDCDLDYGAGYCCALRGYTPQTVQCSLGGYQWSCSDHVLSDPYISTSVYGGVSGGYCYRDFVDVWVGNVSCSYEKASCSTTTPGVCVWTQNDLSCSVYNRPAKSSCGGGLPL